VPVWSAYDASQPTALEPIHVALFAIANHNVTSAAVGVRVHLLPAEGTSRSPVQVPWIEWEHCRCPHVAMRSQVLNERRKRSHRNEHSAAPFAIEYPLALHSGIHQRRYASRTQGSGRFTENTHPIRCWSRNMYAPTEIADEVIFAGVQTHRSAAVRACHSRRKAQGRDLSIIAMRQSAHLDLTLQ
jgi:hypothetical protein